jgi:L-amino acid N-acyltransferase YncA
MFRHGAVRSRQEATANRTGDKLMVVSRVSMQRPSCGIRKATQADAESIVAIIREIASERIYTAISSPWSAEKQRRYIMSLSSREAIHAAETERQVLIGYQTLELWAPTPDSMSHVGQIGTFLKPEWRRGGIGRLLFEQTVDFARIRGFSKFLAQVRSLNEGAQLFYQQLGFRECGRLTRQVRIDGEEDDEIILEYFL